MKAWLLRDDWLVNSWPCWVMWRAKHGRKGVEHYKRTLTLSGLACVFSCSIYLIKSLCSSLFWCFLKRTSPAAKSEGTISRSWKYSDSVLQNNVRVSVDHQAVWWLNLSVWKYGLHGLQAAQAWDTIFKTLVNGFIDVADDEIKVMFYVISWIGQLL